MPTLPKVLIALFAVLVLAFVAGCGGGDDDEPMRSGAGNGTDAAFVAGMVPHHEGAIEMAQLARKQAEHRQVRALAEDIITAQKAEIAVLGRIADDLRQMGVEAGDLGMSEHEMGMADMEGLDGAKPFDRRFLDLMIPHHEGAVAMARKELEDGEQATLRKMAQDIITAQEREIAQMRRWRTAWYGEAAGDDAHDQGAHG
ncbi:MAG TPA: DUF305 domain-containing protein [Baekduia sp.]|nr:DUF305 domain-containing protein [Baekduia sp.]